MRRKVQSRRHGFLPLALVLALAAVQGTHAQAPTTTPPAPAAKPANPAAPKPAAPPAPAAQAPAAPTPAPPATSAPGTSAPTAPAPAAPPAPAGEPAAETGVEGFRSARFGMTDAQVRAVIRSDFKLADTAIKAATHPVEQTRVLQVAVKDLVASGSEAQLAYVFGFRSKTLVQVNVLWSASDTAGAETVVGIANALRALFVGQSQSGRFKKESVAVNSALPDGRVIVFRGLDDKGRAVELVLAAAAQAAPGGARQVGAQLRLMYIQSPDNPDIQKVQPGQF